MHWYDQYDIGLKENWAAPDVDDSTWKVVNIPGGFSELGVPDAPALVWFKREITATRSASARTCIDSSRLD